MRQHLHEPINALLDGHLADVHAIVGADVSDQPNLELILRELHAPHHHSSGLEERPGASVEVDDPGVDHPELAGPRRRREFLLVPPVHDRDDAGTRPPRLHRCGGALGVHHEQRRARHATGLAPVRHPVPEGVGIALRNERLQAPWIPHVHHEGNAERLGEPEACQVSSHVRRAAADHHVGRISAPCAQPFGGRRLAPGPLLCPSQPDVPRPKQNARAPDPLQFLTRKGRFRGGWPPRAAPPWLRPHCAPYPPHGVFEALRK